MDATPDPVDQLRGRLGSTRNPLTIIASGPAWRAVWYCATSIVCGFGALLSGILGVLILPFVADVTTRIERRRLGLLGMPALAATRQDRPGGWRVWRAEDGSFAVWGLTVLFGLVDLLPGGVLLVMILSVGGVAVMEPTFDLAMVFQVGWVWVWTSVGLVVAQWLASAQAYAIHVVLRPHSELTDQVAQLTSSRSELVDLFETERRRIERDLHDGAQQHLVVSNLHLGEAVYWLDAGQPEAARQAVQTAQISLEAGMVALRHTIRGIHPQVLTDHGLVAAVREIAGRQPFGVRVDVLGGERALPQGVESAAYYVVSEGLTNIARHAGASRAWITLDLAPGRLVVQIGDDGRGGAMAVPGHGVSGLAERTRAAGGTFELASPPGGPTQISASFPVP